MAKSKKSKKSLQSYIKYCAIIFAIVGMIMTLFVFVQNNSRGFTGLQVIFGCADKGPFATIEQLSFSFMALFTILLPIIGSVSVLFNNTLVRIIGTALMLVGTILCFLIPNFVVYANVVTEASFANAGLGVGSILAGVLFGLGTCCNFYSIVEK